jgi:hypothetical protein
MTMPFFADERPSARFAELSVVRLRHDIDVFGGILPEGAAGTVVAAYKGAAYEVEFEQPFHAVVTLEHGDLTG